MKVIDRMDESKKAILNINLLENQNCVTRYRNYSGGATIKIIVSREFEL